MFNLFGTNDWTPVWSQSGKWEQLTTSQFKDVKLCHFIIEHSKSRSKYRLITDGYNPKNHPVYNIAMQTLIDYNSKQETEH